VFEVGGVGGVGVRIGVEDIVKELVKDVDLLGHD
jgi:hypothetical protein